MKKLFKALATLGVAAAIVVGGVFAATKQETTIGGSGSKVNFSGSDVFATVSGTYQKFGGNYEYLNVGNKQYMERPTYDHTLNGAPIADALADWTFQEEDLKFDSKAETLVTRYVITLTIKNDMPEDSTTTGLDNIYVAVKGLPVLDEDSNIKDYGTAITVLTDTDGSIEDVAPAIDITDSVNNYTAGYVLAQGKTLQFTFTFEIDSFQKAVAVDFDFSIGLFTKAEAPGEGAYLSGWANEAAQS